MHVRSGSGVGGHSCQWGKGGRLLCPHSHVEQDDQPFFSFPVPLLLRAEQGDQPLSPFSCAQNKATVTYYLLCDNRRRLPSSGYLRSELSEGVPPQQLPPPGSATPGEGALQRFFARRTRGHTFYWTFILLNVLPKAAWHETA